MTYQTDFTLSEELLEQIAQQGLDMLPDLIQAGESRDGRAG